MYFPSNLYTAHLMGELFNIYIDLLSCNILENYFYTICRTRRLEGLEPHMQRTGDMRIC